MHTIQNIARHRGIEPLHLCIQYLIVQDYGVANSKTIQDEVLNSDNDDLLKQELKGHDMYKALLAADILQFKGYDKAASPAEYRFRLFYKALAKAAQATEHVDDRYSKIHDKLLTRATLLEALADDDNQEEINRFAEQYVKMYEEQMDEGK